MIAYAWPIALVVLSNIVYQVCAKEIPDTVSPFSALSVTYFIGALLSAMLYFLTEPDHRFLRELSAMNWAPYVLGIVVVELEVGFIYAYKVGWPVSTASLVQSSFLAVALVFVGYFLYHEALTATKLLGIVICLIGLVFLNR